MHWEIIQEPLRVMWTNTMGFVPNLLAALVILLVGWIVARVVRYLIQRALKLVQLDKVSEKAGINDALKQANLPEPSQVVAKLFYWIVMVLALVMAVNAVKLTVATELLNRLLLYLPNVIAAIFVLVLGFFFGSLVRGLVQTALGGTETMDPEVAGKAAQLAIILFAAAASLEQLRIATILITNAFTVAFAAIAFALALAFGLGCKDLVKGWVEGLLKK